MGRLLCGGICGRMGGASPLSNRQGCAGRVGRMSAAWGCCLNCDFWDSGMGCDCNARDSRVQTVICADMQIKGILKSRSVYIRNPCKRFSTHKKTTSEINRLYRG